METHPDISPHFTPNKRDAQVIRKILEFRGTPEAIRMLDRYSYRLTDYAYWFVLGTLWVNYTGWSDLETWKRLFASTRPNRDACLMKPSELATFARFPDTFHIYRAHRFGETDWIAYTLSAEKAGWFAHRRGVGSVSEYLVRKNDVLCLFLRRDELEVLVLDRNAPTLIRDIPVVVSVASELTVPI